MTVDQGYWTTPEHTLGAAIGLSVLDILAVSLRFVARKKQGQPIKADDWLIVVAALFTLGIAIAMIYGVASKGLAHPLMNPGNEPFITLDTAQIDTERTIQFAYMALMPLASGFSKASFLFFYHRLFAHQRKGWRSVLIISMIVLTFLWITAFFFAFFFQCGTNIWVLRASWEEVVTYCIDDTPLQMSFLATDFLGDLIVFIIPIPMVWLLTMSLGKKLSVMGIFLFGAVSVAVSLTRLVLTARIYYEAFNLTTDPILNVTSFVYFGMIECGMAVFTACLPSFSFFFKGGYLKSILSTVRSVAESSTSRIGILQSKTSRLNESGGSTSTKGTNFSASINSGTVRAPPVEERPAYTQV